MNAGLYRARRRRAWVGFVFGGGAKDKGPAAGLGCLFDLRQMAEGGYMHIGSVLLTIWLVIGGLAAGQRGDYHGTISSCSRASTTAVTIAAGPLNYLGVKPKIHCTTPQPSS